MFIHLTNDLNNWKCPCVNIRNYLYENWRVRERERESLLTSGASEQRDGSIYLYVVCLLFNFYTKTS